MDELSREEFEQMKKTASEKVLEMHRNSGDRRIPPYPDFVSMPGRNTGGQQQQRRQAQPSHSDRQGSRKPPDNSSEEEKNSKPNPQKSPPPAAGISGRMNEIVKYINMPELLKNKDALLLLGLILLLSSEGADEKLILALAYILL